MRYYSPHRPHLFDLEARRPAEDALADILTSTDFEVQLHDINTFSELEAYLDRSDYIREAHSKIDELFSNHI